MVHAWGPVQPLVLNRDLLSCALLQVVLGHNGRRCARDTLTRCPTTSSSIPFDSCYIWIIHGGPPWVEVPPSYTQHIGDTPGSRSTMFQGPRILHSSMVRPISSLDRSFSTQPIYGNFGCCRISIVFAESRSRRARKPLSDYIRQHRTLERTSRGTLIRERPNIRSPPIGVLTDDALGRKTIYGPPIPRLFSISSTPVADGSNRLPVASSSPFCLIGPWDGLKGTFTDDRGKHWPLPLASANRRR